MKANFSSSRSGRSLPSVAVVLVTLMLGISACAASGVRDAASMPEHIAVCGRSWQLSHASPASLAATREREGVDPVVVEVGLFAPCPPGPCTNIATAQPCYTVVHVRVGDDAYVAYELEGGP